MFVSVSTQFKKKRYLRSYIHLSHGHVTLMEIVLWYLQTTFPLNTFITNKTFWVLIHNGQMPFITLIYLYNIIQDL